MNTRTITRQAFGYLIAALPGGVPAVALAQVDPPVDRYQITETVSAEAATQLQKFYATRRQRPAQPHPVADVDWDRQNLLLEAALIPQAKQIADSLGVTATAEMIGGVPVLRIRSADYKSGGRTLVYIHGGAYVRFSARSTLVVPALVAAAGGGEVISIDYTLAPRGTWRNTTEQVLAVWRGLLASGARAESVGLFGDSAGGGLAAGAVLKMRDTDLPLPGALWLLSPWSDITATGDSYTTLAGADPILNGTMLKWAAEIYAPLADRKNPYVSPVYGDYAKPFPPTLIQVGTREIFLSNAVREYQAIRSGGHLAVLDVYEGMPHVFQSLLPTAPETHTAVERAIAFFAANLKKR
jgi:monoterpene epsilon-lactone hydrolase